MVRQAVNITLEPDVYEEFCKYAGKKGIRVSAWVNAKMKSSSRKKSRPKAKRSPKGKVKAPCGVPLPTRYYCALVF